MNAKSFTQLVNDLETARGIWERLHGFYVKFCERAMDMADAGCPAKGIVSVRVGDDLYVQYLDRRLRFSFGFDRPSSAGIICVEDLSVIGLYEGPEPDRIATISFDNGGTSDVVGVNGKKLSLLDEAEGIQLALAIVDRALDHNPWKIEA